MQTLTTYKDVYQESYSQM